MICVYESMGCQRVQQLANRTETQVDPPRLRKHITALGDKGEFQELRKIMAFFTSRRKRVLKQLR